MCIRLRTSIVEDKHIWIRILDEGTRSGKLHVPSNLVSLEEASARTIQRWVKHAIVLREAYERPSLKRGLIRMDTPARVTFARLIRGKWCLVASSNTSISELSIWEIVSPSSCILHYRTYLQAPVVDGCVDDGGHYVRLAITIAARCVVRYIIDFLKLTLLLVDPGFRYWKLQRMTMIASCSSNAQR